MAKASIEAGDGLNVPDKASRGNCMAVRAARLKARPRTSFSGLVSTRMFFGLRSIVIIINHNFQTPLKLQRATIAPQCVASRASGSSRTRAANRISATRRFPRRAVAVIRTLCGGRLTRLGGGESVRACSCRVGHQLPLRHLPPPRPLPFHKPYRRRAQHHQRRHEEQPTVAAPAFTIRHYHHHPCEESGQWPCGECERWPRAPSPFGEHAQWPFGQ